jgi:D-glycero-alpha-D-manno-heptose-7-phosphate kinase
MAIDIKHHCVLQPTECSAEIEAMKEKRLFYRLPERGKDPKFDLIYEIFRSYELLNFDHWGVKFEDKFDGIQSAGLGSSASAAVSMIGVFNEWLNIKQSRKEIAKKAWQMELNLGWISGWQDQFASAIGGFNFFEYKEGEILRQSIEREIAQKFAGWCLLVFTGKTRHSAEVHKGLKQKMEDGSATKSLQKMMEVTETGRNLLSLGEFKYFGQLVDYSWELKKQTNPFTSNPRLDEIYKKAIKAGALGGKICGSGGEGHFFFVTEPRKKEKVIQAIGLQEIKFNIDFEGLKVRRINGDSI